MLQEQKRKKEFEGKVRELIKNVKDDVDQKLEELATEMLKAKNHQVFKTMVLNSLQR